MESNEQNKEQESGLQTTSAELMPAVSPASTVIGNNAGKLAEILMDNIDKVQNDPKYIPQAQEISSQINQLVQLAKTEIDMYRVAQKMR